MGLFKGKLPTDLDVARLCQHIGTPVIGQRISYMEIEDTLGLSRDDGRWSSVVTAWRKKLDRENNLLLKAIPGEGFEVMDSHARVDFSGRIYKGGLKRISRSALVAARTDRTGLADEELKTLDHLQNIGAAIRTQAATAARKLSYPEPTLKAVAQG